MKRRTNWLAFFAAVIASSIVGPTLILLYMYFDYPYGTDAPFLIRYHTIAVVCPAWMLGVVEHNSGPMIAFIAICVGNLIVNLIVSILLLAPAKLPFGSIAALICAVAIVLAREISIFGAGPMDRGWLVILIAAALYWAPVAVKTRLDARLVLAN